MAQYGNRTPAFLLHHADKCSNFCLMRWESLNMSTVTVMALQHATWIVFAYSGQSVFGSREGYIGTT